MKNQLSIKVYDSRGHTVAASVAGTFVNLVCSREYQLGDRIGVEIENPGVFCEVRYDDAMPPAIVYVTERSVSFPIPHGEQKLVYSPKSFAGAKHVISARIVEDREAYARRNMAFNPYDYAEAAGVYPHASANVETRGESVFAARNTIDGIFANASHGEYPYQSWGINRRPDAQLSLDLGVLCRIDEVRLTLRADFPHDNYWTAATLCFEGGGEDSEEVVALQKRAEPQVFPVNLEAREVTLKDLVMSSEPSPFPALTQIEVWGCAIPALSDSSIV